ncbi:MAG TPA: hypothetical protein VFT70_06210 [Nocardioides sp.]|nr:hypothetical protein [Nocardioides sp.]
MADETVSDDRATGIRRLLLVELVLAAILVLLSIPLLVGDYRVYGSIVLGIAVVLGALGSVALRAVQERRPQARRLSIATGIVLVVLSIPLMPIWIGLITVVAGIGLLVVSVAPEREDR